MRPRLPGLSPTPARPHPFRKAPPPRDSPTPLLEGPAPWSWPQRPSSAGCRPVPAAYSPCRCRRAGSAPARVPAQSSSAAGPNPTSAFSPRPPGAPWAPTATSDPGPGAARVSTVPASGPAPPAASHRPAPAAPPHPAPPSPRRPAPRRRGRAAAILEAGTRRKRPSSASVAGGRAALCCPLAPGGARWPERGGRGRAEREHERRRCPDGVRLLTRLRF